MQRRAHALVIPVVIALLVVVGYVAGRMSRFDGGRQGVAVWLWSLVAVGILALLGAVAACEVCDHRDSEQGDAARKADRLGLGAGFAHAFELRDRDRGARRHDERGQKRSEPDRDQPAEERSATGSG